MSAQPPLLEVRDVSITFGGRKRLLFRSRSAVQAVIGASFSISPGETLGLVGESGSGKSSVGRAVLGLIQPESGEIYLNGSEITRFEGEYPKKLRRSIQTVFQNPHSSLNPTMLVRDIVGEPLEIHTSLSASERKDRIRQLLHQVGLADHHVERYPYEFSGGQRQRVSIARALACEPDLLVLDEPVSALDVSVQSQVIRLLEDIQATTGVAYLFIAHDLAVVRHASKDIAVMYHGRIVEQGPADDICDDPQHPYTKMLLAYVPELNPTLLAERKRLRHAAVRELDAIDVADPSGAPTSSSSVGCPFVDRCPIAVDRCASEFPDWSDRPGGGRVACHQVGLSPSP